VTIDELGSVGEIVGAIATVATLLYLSLQIRANTLATKRQSLDDTIERVVQWQARLVESPDLARAWIDGTKSFRELSLDNQIRFTAQITEILGGIEATLEAAKFGNVKPETVGAVQAMISNLLRNEGVREWWETNGRRTFAHDFVIEVERISETHPGIADELTGPMPFHISDADRT
jgi:hypothetical protein